MLRNALRKLRKQKAAGSTQASQQPEKQQRLSPSTNDIQGKLFCIVTWGPTHATVDHDSPTDHGKEEEEEDLMRLMDDMVEDQGEPWGASSQLEFHKVCLISLDAHGANMFDTPC